jgi:hypothetical protein
LQSKSKLSIREYQIMSLLSNPHSLDSSSDSYGFQGCMPRPPQLTLAQISCTTTIGIYLTILLRRHLFCGRQPLFNIRPIVMASHIEHIDGKVQISTARLLLRPAEENDAESLYDILGDPKVMVYWYSNSDRKEGVCLLLWLGASFRMRI